jgi:hypothetical protein
VAHALGLPAAPLVPLAHAPAALRRTSADVVVIAGADIPL